MKIKALSFWEPWASLIGLKTIETRPRKFNYRGPLLICASVFGAFPGRKRRYVIERLHVPQIRQALSKLFKVDDVLGIYFKLSFGQAVSICNLTDCHSTNGTGWMQGMTPEQIEREKVFGDFSPDRFALRLENIRPIKPFPVIGRQGLFDVEVPEGLI